MANLLSAVVLTALGLEMAAGAHLVLGAFNLLPVRPLDGGRALYLAAAFGCLDRQLGNGLPAGQAQPRLWEWWYAWRS
ncbi:MAG: hypothetical protein V8R75_00350 [Oscillospiraceae bacterium]